MSAANENKVINVQVPLSLMTLESMCETSLGISNLIKKLRIMLKQ